VHCRARVACAATAANVNGPKGNAGRRYTLVFEQLFLAAFAVMARIRTVFADKGYDADIIAISVGSSVPNPVSTSAASHTDQGRAGGAGRSSAAMPWTTNVSPYAMTAAVSSSSHYFRPSASSWLQTGWTRKYEDRRVL